MLLTKVNDRGVVLRFIAVIAVAATLVAFGPVDFGPVDAVELVGRPRIVDGDTLAYRDGKVRLHGIDAPENAQHCLDAAGGDYRCGEDVFVFTHIHHCLT